MADLNFSDETLIPHPSSSHNPEVLPTSTMNSPNTLTHALSQISHNPSETYLNPYFLHHNDNTSLVLVNELLIEENYVSWSRAMIFELSIKNKISLMDVTLPRPPSDMLLAWIRNKT
ncbi:uncharacterized protein E5676_scaffold952G00310 [Cucumis melo var. makuwa]|uniref:Retrotransposon Copia-like N-terminal domain-containing protein n=1 Tax=Cucumis melo var. makuwa TaxID=1194695 RepID=A0A5D3CMC2_CUCMM|nr:uncharacterized protein E6C27_scaffold60G001140 [Cucumis melo var. makuwa]TYK11566.1 uncharacterized protein E5676_scaffold952G00310 [Cucumis melo var. makuwa]